MLRRVSNFQINRLFWPDALSAEEAPQADLLLGHARRIMRCRLKSVYYYNPPAPTVEINAAQPAVKIVEEGVGRCRHKSSGRCLKRAIQEVPRAANPTGR